jgi:hypothetical protein
MGSVFIALPIIVSLYVFLFLSKFFTHAVHESGHALACVAQGGTVPDYLWLLLDVNAETDCTPAIYVKVATTVGGPVLQLSVWFLVTFALMWWASHWTTAKLGAADVSHLLGGLVALERPAANRVDAPPDTAATEICGILRD